MSWKIIIGEFNKFVIYFVWINIFIIEIYLIKIIFLNIEKILILVNIEVYLVNLRWKICS